MNDDSARPRRYACTLLILAAAATVAGHIGSAQYLPEPDLHTMKRTPQDQRRVWPTERPTPMPTFSSNDRSRWATIRALVDGDPETGEATYVIGRRDPARATAKNKYGDYGIVFEDGYGTVDKVLHPEKMEFYSSKPPLLSTLVAGLYWVLQLLTGWTLKDNPFEVVRTILLLVNLVPFVIYLALLARLVERYGSTDWGRLFVLTAACFATLMNPFAIALNNHTVATCSVVFALYPALRIWRETQAPDGVPAPWLFAVAGLFASFAVCNELPALAFAGALFVLLLWRRPGKTLLFFLPAAAVPVAALIVTNYLAIGQMKPAYAEFGGPWYEYEGSHWRRPNPGEVRRGIDWARQHESRAEYAFHVLLGHHGLFSLSPVWLLAVAGMLLALRYAGALRRPPAPEETVSQGRRPPPGPELVLVGGLTLVLTVVVVGFYLWRSDNYGGWTNGLRWLMWLSPLWLLTMLPVADRLSGNRWGRWVAYALLAASIFSTAYRSWNPWRHPWLFDLMDAQGWIPY